MDTSQVKSCRNCDATMPASANFCPGCGQKYTTGKVPVKTFIQDFISNYFNLDSRLFKTLFALAIPGKLTVEYFKGKHKRYASPIQLFIVAAVFLFALVGWHISNTDLGDNVANSLQEIIDWNNFYQALDSTKQEVDSLFADPVAHAATDSLAFKLKALKPNIRDSITLDSIGVLRSDLPSPAISIKDLLEKSPKELVDHYGKGMSFTEKMLMRQAAKLKQGGRSMIEFFIGKLGITALVMMPFLALLLKLLYIRGHHYFVEHLVFTFHFHAFAFTLLLVQGLLRNFLSMGITVLAVLAILVYLYLAMLNVYQQGWFKTLIKFGLVILGYVVLTILFAALAFVGSFLLF